MSYDDTTLHGDPVVQAVAEKLAQHLYSLDWDMAGFDHDHVRDLAELATKTVRRAESVAFLVGQGVSLERALFETRDDLFFDQPAPIDADGKRHVPHRTHR